MSDLSNYIVKSLLRELEEGVTVLLPGGFKPPHGGHLDLATKYADLPQVSQVKILIGPKERDGFTRDQSMAVWKELLAGNPNITVEAVAEDNPLLAAYKFIENAKPGTYALAASSKGEDYVRVQKFVQGHQQGAKYNRPGVNVIELPLDVKPLVYKDRRPESVAAVPGKSDNGKGISASVLRVDLKNNDYNGFETNYPNVQSEATLRAVWGILRKTLQESKLRVFDFDDTLVQTDSKIYVHTIDGRKIPMTPAEYAVYMPNEGDKFDYTEFGGDIKFGKELKQYTNLAKKMIQSPDKDRKVVVLTARSEAKPVQDFLKTIGIDIEVIAVASSDPAKKSEWIEKQIQQGYDDIYFLDDSPKNIAAVKSMGSKYPNIKLRAQTVPKQDMPAQNFLRETLLLTEGGAAGHLAHPYEDYELSFDDVKNMITAALSGKLEYAQEKLDGQNLMITFKDGQVRAARNKGQIKNFGENSLTTNQIKQMFSGRGAIESAFVESMKDLETAINKLDKTQKEKFFENGKKFISLEILYPDTTNVVPYGSSQIRMHHFKVYDQEGNIMGEDVAGIYELQKALNLVQAENQKTFKIKTTDPAELKQDTDYEAQLKNFLDKLKNIQNQFSLKGNDQLNAYFAAWWKKYIEDAAKKYNYKITPELLQLLVKRWAFYDKSVKIGDIKKQIADPKFLAWVDNFDKTEVDVVRKTAGRPVESLFLELGVRVLRNISNLTTINPDDAVSKMKADVEAAISGIKSVAQDPNAQKSDAAMKFLKRELLRLRNIGGYRAILPTEGIVFKYNGKLYKLTGAFAPINQILGYLRF